MTALGGHINHIYEDLDLRFRDIKQIFKSLGHADIDAYEKIDGQNLYISWDFENDKLRVARNKQNIKDGGLDRYGLSLKFGDRPKIEDLFTEAYDVISNGLKNLNYNQKVQIFGSTGNIWFSVEIINPEIPNTIQYDGKAIIFHEFGLTLFGYDGNPITSGLPRNMAMLKKAIPLVNNGINGWKIETQNPFPLGSSNDRAISEACNAIDELLERYKMPDRLSVRNYASERLRKDMQRFLVVPEAVRDDLSKSILKITGALKTKEVLDSLDFQIKEYAKEMINEEKGNILPKILFPIENIVHKFSSNILSSLKSEYIVDIEKESARINKEFIRCCNAIRNSGDQKKMNLLLEMQPKVGLGKITMEGLVFKFRDKIYKITGSYAPMNRIIATVHYENEKRKPNPNVVPLGLFVSS